MELEDIDALFPTEFDHARWEDFLVESPHPKTQEAWEALEDYGHIQMTFDGSPRETQVKNELAYAVRAVGGVDVENKGVFYFFFPDDIYEVPLFSDDDEHSFERAKEKAALTSRRSEHKMVVYREPSVDGWDYMPLEDWKSGGHEDEEKVIVETRKKVVVSS